MEANLGIEAEYRDIESAQAARLITWKPYMELEKTKYDAFFSTMPYMKPLHCEHYPMQFMKTAFFYCLERVQRQDVVKVITRDHVQVANLSRPAKYWPAPSKFEILDEEKFKQEFREYFETKHSILAKNEGRDMTQREKTLHNKNLFQRWNQVLGFKLIGAGSYLGYPKLSKITCGAVFVRNEHYNRYSTYTGIVAWPCIMNRSNPGDSKSKDKTAAALGVSPDSATVHAVSYAWQITNSRANVKDTTTTPLSTEQSNCAHANSAENSGLELLCDVALRPFN